MFTGSEKKLANMGRNWVELDAACQFRKVFTEQIGLSKNVPFKTENNIKYRRKTNAKLVRV